MDRTSSARWEGDLKSGKGMLRIGDGSFTGAYSAGSRFANEAGNNPEELIAAAHASCFSMAFAAGLSKAGFAPKRIETSATVHLTKVGEGYAITGIDLVTTAEVPGAAPELVAKTGEDAKKNCPVSKALAAVPITLKVSGGQ
jgi:lipoyl-dependent peroxiredoxin